MAETTRRALGSSAIRTETEPRLCPRSSTTGLILGKGVFHTPDKGLEYVWGGRPGWNKARDNRLLDSSKKMGKEHVQRIDEQRKASTRGS